MLCCPCEMDWSSQLCAFGGSEQNTYISVSNKILFTPCKPLRYLCVVLLRFNFRRKNFKEDWSFSLVQGKSQNHRKVEFGRNLWRPSGQTVCSRKATYRQLPMTMSSWFFSTSKEGDSTTSMGNLCQCSVIFTVKKCFFMFRRNLLHFSLCPLPTDENVPIANGDGQIHHQSLWKDWFKIRSQKMTLNIHVHSSVCQIYH